MPTIVFASPKGGAGKTTAATIFATILAEQGAAKRPVTKRDAGNAGNYSQANKQRDQKTFHLY